jgi:hypothetical protein
MALSTPDKQATAFISPKVETLNIPSHQKTVGVKEAPPPEEYREANFNPIMQEIADVFGDEYRLAIAVAMAESELKPDAVNVNSDGSRDIGIFQINERHGWSEEDLFDWSTNISIAKYLRDRSGWSTWAAYNNETYRRYL